SAKTHTRIRLLRPSPCHGQLLTASHRRGRRRPRHTVAAILAVPDAPRRHAAASSSPASRAAPDATPRLVAPASPTTPGGRTRASVRASPCPAPPIDSDLLICGILLWNRVRDFGFAGDRVHEL